MLVTRLRLTNWRNFREADIPLHDHTYLLGPNASGKSNLMDVFRFLRDVCKEDGGGLQAAINKERGGVSKIRCLHARKNPEVRIDVELSDSVGDKYPRWRYVLGFKKEPRGSGRSLVSCEEVYQGTDAKPLLSRPSGEDELDDTRLRQTHLEQTQTNQAFRQIADFFSTTMYLHLVPQLLTHGDLIGGRQLEADPFGQGFLERIARTPESTRERRLAKIGNALEAAVPQFRNLEFERDEITGRPHLRAQYAHHRPNAGWQREDQFSDGTLRLIGLLWSLLDGRSLLLLEEPELSLNDAIVKEVPFLLHRVQSNGRQRRQIILSTHSEALLSNPGIDGRGVLLITVEREGNNIRPLNQDELSMLKAGLSVSDVVLPKARPEHPEQMAFQF